MSQNDQAKKRGRWVVQQIFSIATKWYQRTQKRLGPVSERSSWWCFAWCWDTHIPQWLNQLRLSEHRFSPMTQYRFTDEVMRVWSYVDRLMIHLILSIIRPTFKYVISPVCSHLAGPSAVKGVVAQIKAALNTQRFRYALRTDIRSYYASIDHQILLGQLTQHYDDPILRRYFEAIVTTAVDDGGRVFVPTQGIPLRSGLSPFFGALYLSALDRAFEHRQGIFYHRYMDDVIILAETKKQFSKAKKRLFAILRGLRLQVSPRKTWMGRLQHGFHFLGCEFEVSQNPQTKTQETTVTLHKRSYRRALDKVQAMRDDAVHPAKMQRYLIRWATWWLNESRFRLFVAVWLVPQHENLNKKGAI